MPNFSFFQTLNERNLPLDLQRLALSYLSVDDLSHVAHTSKALTQLLIGSQPKPSVTLHERLQLFREWQAILDGYRVLQQSTLPDWLKARWSVKKNMLTAIGQALIALDRDPLIPRSAQFQAMNNGLILTNAWPNFRINIHRHDLSLLKKSVVDTLSLQALLADCSLELQFEGEVINDQPVALALLEMVEIFLSTNNQANAQEGLAMLVADYKADSILIGDFLSSKGIMPMRNKWLGYHPMELFDEVDSSDDEATDDAEHKSRAMQKTALFLSAPALLAYMKRYFTINQAMYFRNDDAIELILSANGSAAFDKGFLTFENVERLASIVPPHAVVDILKLWLTDASLLAFSNGLINLNACRRILRLEKEAGVPKMIDKGTIYIQTSQEQPDQLSLYWYEGENRIHQQFHKISFADGFFEGIAADGISTDKHLCQEISSISGYTYLNQRQLRALRVTTQGHLLAKGYKAMLTNTGIAAINSLGIHLEAINTPAKWTALLTRLNEACALPALQRSSPGLS